MLENLDKEAGNPNFDLSKYMHACTLDMVCGKLTTQLFEFTELFRETNICSIVNFMQFLTEKTYFIKFDCKTCRYFVFYTLSIEISNFFSLFD